MQMPNNSRFSVAPERNVQRSTFDRPQSYVTAFNAGDLIPVYWDEVLPGDTVEMHNGMVVRESTPIHPVFGNANVETFWFFVPNRLLWDDWEHFITGGLDAGAWDTPKTYIPPTVHPLVLNENGVSHNESFRAKSLADYLGCPIRSDSNSNRMYCNVSALPFRAYAKIWNDWFRSSSLQQEVLIPKTGGRYDFQLGTRNSSSGVFAPAESATAPASCVYGGSLLKANKYHDYFTSCLPEPQRGLASAIPADGSLRVVTADPATLPSLASFAPNNKFAAVFGSGAGASSPGLPSSSDRFRWLFHNGSAVSVISGGQSAAGSTDGSLPLVPLNLIADASDGASGLTISINDLRHAVAVQHILEIDARSGSGRYIDMIKGHFGVDSADARLQRAEYLGGSCVPVNVQQVLQTSSTNDTSPQGNTAAFSLTADTDHPFTHSFTEHGILMCLAVVRIKRSYQDGLARKWSRQSRYDYYWPSLANISEQAVLNKEIFCGDVEDVNNEAFGYQEAFADYRYSPSLVTGAMRSSYAQSLDVWHYADEYAARPYLSADWLQEDSAEIDRTLAVSSSLADQFIGDFAFKPTWYRVMPVYSIPGLDRM